MTKEKLGGNIILNGFDIDSAEKLIVKKMIGKYAEKIRNMADYQEILLTMQIHKEVKTEKYEIYGLVILSNGKAESTASGFNPFILVNEVMQKIIKEIEGKFKQ